MVLFIMLYKVVLTFESVDEIFKCYHSDQMKAILSSTYRCCCLRWPNTVCVRFTDSVSDAIKLALGLW